MPGVIGWLADTLVIGGWGDFGKQAHLPFASSLAQPSDGLATSPVLGFLKGKLARRDHPSGFGLQTDMQN